MHTYLRTIGLALLIFSGQSSLFSQSKGEKIKMDTFPIITFDQPYFELGKIDSGVVATFDMSFRNTGKRNLIIEVVSACKCIDIDWPRSPIVPDETGVITVSFDTRGQKLGPIKKIIDIVANTDPIVVEAEMRCHLISP